LTKTKRECTTSNDARGKLVTFASPRTISTFASRCRHELPGRRDEVLTLLQADHGSARPDALGEQVEHALRPTAEIDRLGARRNFEAIEQPTRFARKLVDLFAEAFLLDPTAPEKIDVSFRHHESSAECFDPARCEECRPRIRWLVSQPRRAVARQVRIREPPQTVPTFAVDAYDRRAETRQLRGRYASASATL